MPTYEYKCDACGKTFEKFQSMSSAPIKKCPNCGKTKVRRLIGTGAGLIFKGSGFYITDYRDSKYQDSAKADSNAAKPDGESKGESKSDAPATGESKPAAAPAESKPAPASAQTKSTPASSRSESKSEKPKK